MEAVLPECNGGFYSGSERIVGYLPDPETFTGSLDSITLEASVSATMASGPSSISQSGNLAVCTVGEREL